MNADWSIRGQLFLAGVETAVTWCDGPPEGSDARPVILITTEEFAINDAAIEALAADQELYQRGGSLVRVITRGEERDNGIAHAAGPCIVELARATLQEHMARFAQWEKETEGAEESVRCPAHPPRWAVEAVLARGHWVGIRPLEAVSDYPVIRRDGSVLCMPGYDAATGIYLAVPVPGLSIPEAPSRDDARAAIATLLDTVCDFPFAEPTHRSAFVAGLLTPLARFAFDGPAPLFLIDANAPGAGKGLLCDLVSLIVTGTRFATSSYSHESAEMRKAITASALAGDRLILLDNINGRFGNSALDQALTTTVWRDRKLGFNKNVTLPLFAIWFATGNNIELAGDMVRRLVHVRLQTDLERPETRRDFRHADLREHVREHRSALLSAALTLLAAFVRAGCPQSAIEPFGSFEGWSRLVRGACIWAGLPDPAATRAGLRETADAKTLAVSVVLRDWHLIDSEHRGLTAGEFIKLVFEDEQREATTELRDATDELLKKRDSREAGMIFRRYAGRKIDGRTLQLGSTVRGARRWTVQIEQPNQTSHSDLSGGCGGGDGGYRNPRAQIGGDEVQTETQKCALEGSSPPPPPSPPPPDEPVASEVSPEVESILSEVIATLDNPSTRNLCNDARKLNDVGHARALLGWVQSAASRYCSGSKA